MKVQRSCHSKQAFELGGDIALNNVLTFFFTVCMAQLTALMIKRAARNRHMMKDAYMGGRLS